MSAASNDYSYDIKAHIQGGRKNLEGPVDRAIDQQVPTYGDILGIASLLPTVCCCYLSYCDGVNLI